MASDDIITDARISCLNTTQSSNNTEPISPYRSSPVFSCMVVSTSTRPTDAQSPTVEHPVFSAPKAEGHKHSVDSSRSELAVNRIRRKSVPYYGFESGSESTGHSRPEVPEVTSPSRIAVSERDVGSRGPLDGKGRPLHRIGGVRDFCSSLQNSPSLN